MRGKFSIQDFARYRKNIDRHYQLTTSVGPGTALHKFLGMPVDWEEFRLLYYSKRPVVVECPKDEWRKGESMLEMFAALRSGFEARKVGLYSWFDWGVANSNCYFNVIALNKNRASAAQYVRTYDSDDTDNIPSAADDWVFKKPAEDATWLSHRHEIEYVLETTNGFKDWVDLGKRVVVLWASEQKDGYDKLKETYGNRFLFLDYVKEKRFVEDWKRENGTILDPLFDIRLMDKTMDRRRALSYLATNYPQEFKDYISSIGDDQVPKSIMEMAR